MVVAVEVRWSSLVAADRDLMADLRAADVRGADLAVSLFLTQPQVEAAVGDATTALPVGLTRPRHWAA